MLAYIVKRLLLMVPTLLGVLLMTFVVIQFVPGGPVEQMVAQLQGRDSGAEGSAAAGRVWTRRALKKSRRCMVLTSLLHSGSG